MYSPMYLQAGQASNAWIWYVLVAVIVLLLIFWWINRRQDVTLDQPPQAAIQIQREQVPDDLQRIEGIGPKVSRVLNEAGITTFASLAKANPAQIQQVLNAAGLQMMNPEGWIEQASLAARGDWEGLQRLQGELRGGRKT